MGEGLVERSQLGIDIGCVRSTTGADQASLGRSLRGFSMGQAAPSKLGSSV
ncbi:hypothetical protein [Leptolyngbya sp. CCY15150]|uniref:hypothetical protein n=1 Tax=Leptolyngbya sp. CCY15150 TaxID=2767772 RepID=UPI00194EB691|nr:hypothetical protein [Leptolyngbya sp. CCY15150]